MMHIYIRKLAHHYIRKCCAVICTKPLPDPVPNNCHLWTLRRKLQWSLHFQKMHFKMLSVKLLQFWLGLNISSASIGVQLFMILQTYCQTPRIRCTKSQNLKVPCLILQFSLPNPLKPGRWQWRCGWRVPTGNASTTSEWSTILLPTKVLLIVFLNFRWHWAICRHMLTAN